MLAAVTGISVGCFILSISFLVYAASFSVLTPQGEEQAARWKGFQVYLQQAGKGWEPAPLEPPPEALAAPVAVALDRLSR